MKSQILCLATSVLASGVLLNGTAAAEDATVRLITLDPGHFHASLVQKFMYPQVSPVVHVYAPAAGWDLQEHLNRIQSFNTRAENPTRWEEKIYTGPDFLNRMVREKSGNVVVISGNNQQKTEYIDESIKAGLNVLADKPMVIAPAGFGPLRKDFERAAKKKVLLYDIMTERFEITAILQRELARMPEVFGTLEKGTPTEPAVVMESVHHYFKEVAGKPLIRPAWFFDIGQQGEAIPDVGTHLVDLVQWEAFPDQALNYKKDIKVLSANRWPTKLTPEQFKRVTGLSEYPAFLQKAVDANGVLNVYENGDVTWTIRGVHAKVTALWNFEPPAGAKDTHYSLMRGSQATLTIKQGPEQGYQPTLYVENKSRVPAEQFERTLRAAVAKLCATWPGVEVKPAGQAWEIVLPAKYAVGHEAHFAQVTENFLRFLKDGKMPEWEVPNMLAKYYTTTEAYRLSHARKSGK
ncbi:MAG TPA: putative oxidoreductase C-terminal domain-containing protein [Candidatus Sulfotelmatobacter sp.]|nr:putative oxidoreductase C-terminal domain-containing protein [Candidatus Sulfotelmatobacter sp.]HWI59724.1 putative oxidoreductase C-terminal domain-containing protein [Bacillota bacterium]